MNEIEVTRKEFLDYIRTLSQFCVRNSIPYTYNIAERTFTIKNEPSAVLIFLHLLKKLKKEDNIYYPKIIEYSRFDFKIKIIKLNKKGDRNV